MGFHWAIKPIPRRETVSALKIRCSKLFCTAKSDYRVPRKSAPIRYAPITWSLNYCLISSQYQYYSLIIARNGRLPAKYRCTSTILIYFNIQPLYLRPLRCAQTISLLSILRTPIHVCSELREQPPMSLTRYPIIGSQITPPLALTATNTRSLGKPRCRRKAIKHTAPFFIIPYLKSS